MHTKRHETVRDALYADFECYLSKTDYLRMYNNHTPDKHAIKMREIWADEGKNKVKEV